MSCTCGNINNCLCQCCTPITTLHTTTTTTICIDGEPCVESIDPNCIIYCGPDLPCYGVKKGDSAADILKIILDLFSANCSTTTTSTSTSTTSTSTTSTTSTSTTTSTTTTSTTTSTTTTSTTTSTTSTTTTTTTTIAPDAFICEDCSPFLENLVTTPSNLSSGDLISADLSCSFDDYAIEWYLDDISNGIQFISGNSTNTDGDIQEFHPFSRPVVSGNWIPIIRYIVIGGSKYYSTYIPGELYSPDLYDCLSEIFVESYNCSNGGTYGNYTHQLIFNDTVNPTDINRSISFEIDSSTNYFAYLFDAFNVTDTIKISYVSGVTTTQLRHLIVGTDNTVFDTYVDPMIVDRQEAADVIDLTSFSYTPGDYLLIEITGNIDNLNTIWSFKCKCLESFSCDWVLPDLRYCDHTIDLVNCVLKINFYVDNYTDNLSTDISKYLMGSYGAVPSQYTDVNEISTTGLVKVSLPFGEVCFLQNTSFDFNFNCTQLNGSYTITKTGANILYEFTDINDYNNYTTNLNNAIATLTPTYTTDTTNINHYKFIILNDLIGTICGDSLVTNNVLQTHYSTIFSLDPIALTISFTITNTVNDLNSNCPTCQNLSLIGNINNIIALPDYTYTSEINYINGTLAYSYVKFDNFTNFTYAYLQIERFIYDNNNILCNTSNSCLFYYNVPPIYNYQYQSYSWFQVAIEITDISDPLNNYRLSNVQNPVDNCLDYPGEVFYEIEEGVEIINLCETTTTTTTTS